MTNTYNRILVTGGAGFIGSHLVEALLMEGCEVRVLDNLSTGQLTNLPTENSALKIIQGDIIDSDVIHEAVKNVDAVVHLAAIASVQASVDDPTATHGSNFLGTLNLLESCRKLNIKRLLYASSAAVYGDSAAVPVSEDAPLNPLTPYAYDKLAGEYYLEFYRRQHGLEPAIFRFFNVFGPRQDPSSPYSGVISIFVDRALTNQTIDIFGDGEQTRDFIYVKDLVAVLLKALALKTVEPGAVNIGTGHQVSLNKMITILEKIMATKFSVINSSARPGDIRDSMADISRLQERFNSKPVTTLQEGLKELLTYQEAVRE